MQDNPPLQRPTTINNGTTSIVSTSAGGFFTVAVPVSAVLVVTSVTATINTDNYSNAFGNIVLFLPHREVDSSGNLLFQIDAQVRNTSIKAASKAVYFRVWHGASATYAGTWNITYSISQTSFY